MSALTLLHTADWQIGKPFASTPDPAKRRRLQQERLASIARIADLVRTEHVNLVLVAGDIFDSPSPEKSTVSATFHAIGQIPVPVIAIPGNHDFGGAGGPWEQDFVRQEMTELAPNFHMLTQPKPYLRDELVILPAPLEYRQNHSDPCAWIHSAFQDHSLPADRPRVVLAHGSVQGFSSAGDENATHESNLIDLERLPFEQLDYIALGDWHGTKQVAQKAWYAGTPEIDRFPKGEHNDPGHVLKVQVARGSTPHVEPHPTAAIRWHQLQHHFDLESGLPELRTAFENTVGTGAGGALLQLELSGQLGIQDAIELQQLIETWEARLLRLKLRNHVIEAPSDEEIERLTQRAEDPLITRVAIRLLAMANGDSDDAAAARLALRSLYQTTLA